MATNVRGNYRGGTALTKVRGQGVKTLIETTRVKKGISFKKQAINWGQRAKGAGLRAAQRGARSYTKYGKPTVSLAKTLGKIALKPIKWSLRAPGITLAATGAYYGAKALGKKYGRKYNFSPVRQFDKKGRKII